MVRTRNTRNNSGGGGGARDSSASFKPLTSGAKKGRKRQLTEPASPSADEASSSSALVPGSSSALLGPGTSHQAHRGHGQDQGSDLNNEEMEEEGYLAPQAPASFNNNQATNIQVAAWLENSPETDPELIERVESPLSTSPEEDIVHSAAADLVMHASTAHAQSASSLTPGLVSVASGSGHQALEVGLVTSSRVTLLPEDLKSNLECPVCARISLPPIMQCRNGHVTCNPCRLKVQSCPVCREVDIDIRNLFAEKAVTFMTIPCEYKQYGCRVEIQFKDKEIHERSCKYRPYICPYIECDHKLAFGAVVDHVSIAHREECRRSDGPEITASMILIGMYFGGDGAWSPRVITCFGKTFFDVALTRDRWLHHWVWLLGEEEEASQFTYEITAFKGNTKYVYGSEVASLRTSDDEIVSDGKCLSISDAIGRRLRDGDKIRYKLKLMRK